MCIERTVPTIETAISRPYVVVLSAIEVEVESDTSEMLHSRL